MLSIFKKEYFYLILLALINLSCDKNRKEPLIISANGNDSLLVFNSTERDTIYGLFKEYFVVDGSYNEILNFTKVKFCFYQKQNKYIAIEMNFYEISYTDLKIFDKSEVDYTFDGEPLFSMYWKENFENRFRLENFEKKYSREFIKIDCE